jgi:hypothetical protein
MSWNFTQGAAIGESPLSSVRQELRVFLSSERRQEAYLENFTRQPKRLRDHRARSINVSKLIGDRQTALTKLRGKIGALPETPITQYFDSFLAVAHTKRSLTIRRAVLDAFSTQVLRQLALRSGYDEWPCLEYGVSPTEAELDELFGLFEKGTITNIELAQVINTGRSA